MAQMALGWAARMFWAPRALQLARNNALSDRECSLLQNEQGSQSSADDENWELFKADDFRMYCMKVTSPSPVFCQLLLITLS